MALKDYKHKVIYGEPITINLPRRDWLKVIERTFLFAEATGDRPDDFVPEEARISFDGEPEVSMRSGLEVRPPVPFRKVEIFNPNENLPLEITLLIGTGDIRDSSVTFNIDPSAALAVNVEKFATEASLPVTVSGRVQIDNEYQYYNPVGVVVRGGAGFDSTTPMHVILPEGTGMAVSGEVLITNTAENPVQTTLAGVSETAPLCVSLCDVSLARSNLAVHDSTINGTLGEINTLITATNGKLDITNNGLGSIAQGIAGLQTTASADRTNNANTANALGTTNTRLNTIATNTARGTMENPIHTTATFEGSAVAIESTHTNPTFTRHTRISSNFGVIDLAGRFSNLRGNSFNANEPFPPQLITVGNPQDPWGILNDITIDQSLPIFDYNFRSQVKLFETNYNRKKLVLHTNRTACLISHEPFALPITAFGDWQHYQAVLTTLLRSWIWAEGIDTPLTRLRNVSGNIISGTGESEIFRESVDATTTLPVATLSSGAIVDGEPAITEVAMADATANYYTTLGGLERAIADSAQQGNGVYAKGGNYKMLRPGETYETESHKPIYVLTADNRTDFTPRVASGGTLEFEETAYDTE